MQSMTHLSFVSNMHALRWSAYLAITRGAVKEKQTTKFARTTECHPSASAQWVTSMQK
jgi:hypothetical protein